MQETLATKLLRPPIRPALVDRARLFAQLDAAPSPALIAVAAPAGFGKSTLVGAWAARQQAAGHTIAWLTLDEDDSDVARLLVGLLAAIRLHQPAVGASALALLRAPEPAQPRAVLTALINDLATLAAPLALVLDDYHRVTSQAPHAALAFLVDHLPPGMRLVILSRSDPPLPLARWRARGLLVELRADDLRFTREETAAFFADVMQIGLTPAQVAALESRTEGWAVGLQLAALSLRGRSDPDAFISAFTGSNRFVLEYLATEVLAGLPAHLRDFLLRTSVLRRLCGELCDAVLGLTPQAYGPASPAPDLVEAPPSPRPFERLSPANSYSSLVLAELEQHNLFVVPLDDEHRWYRYHHLFCDMLRARLMSGASPFELAALHRRASAWCEHRDLLEEAVAYALAGGDDEWTGQLIQRVAPRLLRKSELVTPLGEGPGLATLLEAYSSEHRARNDLEQGLVDQLLAASTGAAALPSTPDAHPVSFTPHPLREHLSERELEVLRLVAAGASNSEIAEQLFISVGTVKKHINNIFGKLGTAHRAQAIAVARQAGLIP